MSSTNKTSNYELSQFIGTDKPAWLGDYNSDMSKIDAQMKLNADGVTSASGSATSANTAIGTLASLTTTDKTNLVSAINEVDGHADTAQGTASDAYTLAGTANTAATNLGTYLTMSQFTTPTATISTGCTITTQDLGCASNSTGSLGKIYGRVYFTSNLSGTATITFATPLRPSSAITINGGAFGEWGDSGAPVANAISVSYSVATDGTCTASFEVSQNRNYRIFFWNSLIFAVDFGDVPLPE